VKPDKSLGFRRLTKFDVILSIHGRKTATHEEQ
jgi:hypothetical protein